MPRPTRDFQSLTVKETVRRMLIHYPMLFQDKADCYSHLFLTIGNGYDWINGCLIDVCSDPNDDQPHWSDESGAPSSASEARIAAESPDLDAMLLPGRILHTKRENHQIRFVLENFDAIFDEPIHSLRDPYPGGDYSDLFDMPPDVQPDWRNACNDTSRALGVWLYQYNQSREYRQKAIDKMAELNRTFRAQHFADEDRRTIQALRPLLEDLKDS